MTNYHLYALYVSAYSDSSHFAAEGQMERAASARRCDWRSSIERAIAEFAIHDATNGTPMRSKEQFDQCLEEGALLFRRLHLRDSSTNVPPVRAMAAALP